MESDFVAVTWSGDDGDGIGRLTVAAAANGYSGRSSAWFNRETVEAFAPALSAYPLESGAPPTIRRGFGGDEPQVHVELQACHVGSLGQVAIRVDLSTEHWTGDREEAQHRVHLELLTTYERLGSFGRDLGRITSRNGEHARIEGERLT